MKTSIQMLLLSFLLLQCQQPMVRDVYSPEQVSGRPIDQPVDQLWPTVVDLNRTVLDVYSVPVLHAVGTCNVPKGIGLFTLKKHDVNYRVLMTSSIETRYWGDLSFGLVLPDSTVFYCQCRWINRIDLDRGHAKVFLPQMDGPLIERFEILDPIDETLAIEYDDLSSCEPGFHRNVIRIIDFGRWSYDVIGEIDVGKSRTIAWSPWTTHDGKVLAWDEAKDEILVWNRTGEHATHAFRGVFKEYQRHFRNIEQILLHPDYDFAILIESMPLMEELALYEQTPAPGTPGAREFWEMYYARTTSTWIVSWHDDSTWAATFFPDSMRLIHCPSGGDRGRAHVKRMWFSPCGRWLLLLTNSYTCPANLFFAIPVAPCFPGFFGEAILLACPDPHENWAYGNAWISDPLSFVVAGGDRLYKWDLEGLHEKLVEEYRAGH